MKRAALYIRVSTQEQAQEGYSVGAQKERLIAYCKAHDWVIADIYVDGGYTGSNLNRPGIQKLMAETDKFDVVLVYKLDRLSRSQRDTLYLIEESFLPHKVDFVSMQESFDTATPFGKAMIGLLAVFAQLEREQIRERTKMGKRERAKAGLYHGGGNPPTGYDYKDGRLSLNPYEAECVRKAFEWYLAGDSLNTIAVKLTDAGYITRNGKPFNWVTIRSIVGNPAYTGQLRYADVVVDGAYEAIITPEQFQAAQSILRKRARAAGNTFHAEYYLTGLLYCGKCGARFHRRNTGKQCYCVCYSRSKASDAMVVDPSCKNKIWKYEELESAINVEVRKVLKSPELAAEISAAKRKVPVAAKQKDVTVERRIRELDKKIAKLMELYQSDGIPPDVLGSSINKLYTEKTALENTLKPDVSPSQAMSFDLAEELLKDAAQVWDFADEKQRRRILLSLVEKITITDEKVDIEWSF